MRVVRLGIAGLGRAGWLIHARTAQRLRDRFRVVAVSDPVAARRDEAVAALGCRAHAEFEALLQEPDIDVLVVASPSHLHVPHALAALQRGRDVIVEKPIALDSADAERLIEAAARARRVLAPFHNRRFEPHFLKVREIAASGLLGEIIQIRMAWHAFTRRWDWQTLAEFGGGALNNNGSHLMDQALVLFGEGEPEVFADRQCTPLTSGDAEDHMKVVLRGAGRPTIDIELTNAAACAQERWNVMGSRGGLRGTMQALEWRWVEASDLPPREVDREAAEGRVYHQDALPWKSGAWHTDIATSEPSHDAFYLDFHDALTGGRPPLVTPQSACRVIRTIERCRAFPVRDRRPGRDRL